MVLEFELWEYDARVCYKGCFKRFMLYEGVIRGTWSSHGKP